MTKSLPRDAVDRAVATHYEKASLDADTLQSLRDQIDAASPSPPATSAPDREPIRSTTSLRTRWMAGIVALAVVAVALMAWPEPAITGEAMAQEFATTHVMQLTPDVEADSFDEARERLAKLDFAAFRPSADAVQPFRLTGARYTMIGGEMGAQFQIEDEAGRPCSLFQVRDDAAFRRVRDAVYEVDGVRVRVWRERGLLMGLAETAS